MVPNLLWKVFVPAFLAIIIDLMGYGLVYPLMTELFAGEEGKHMAAGLSLGWRHFYLGLSFLLFPLASFFGTSIIGDLSAIFGQKKVLVLCMCGLTISFLLMAIGVEFVDISVMLIGRALSGLMAGSQPLAQSSIMDSSTGEVKSRNHTLLTIAISVGIVLGPLIGGLFSDDKIVPFFTLSTPFYIACALALIATIWIALAFPQHLMQRMQDIQWLRPLKTFYEGFTQKDLRPLLIIFACMQIGFSLFYQLIQIFVSLFFNFPTWKIGLFNGYIGVAYALVVLFGAKFLFRYMKVEKIAALSLGLTGIFLILPMIFPNQIFVWIMSFLAAGFDMMAYGTLVSCFSKAVDKDNQGGAMGVIGSIVAATWTLTGFSTNLIDIIGLRWLIACGGGFMLLSFFLMMLYNAHPKRRPS